MNGIIHLLSLLFVSAALSVSWSQPNTVHLTVSGTIIAPDGRPAIGAAVVLLEENDRIDSVGTDSSGRYVLEQASFPKNTAFRVVCIDKSCTASYHSLQYELSGSTTRCEIDMQLRVCEQNRHALTDGYFDHGEAVVFGIDAAWLKEMMVQLPGEAHIRFDLVQFKGESKKLGASRIEAFRQFLDRNGIDRSRYTISRKLQTYREREDDWFRERAFISVIKGTVVSGAN